VKLRPAHLVGLILLLSALRGAEGAILPAGEYSFDARYGLVLSQDRAGVWTEVKQTDHKSTWRLIGGGFILSPHIATPPANHVEKNLPAAELAATRTPWTMRPPAAQCAALHCATAFAI
jgi:hypothetical protein